MSWLSLRRSPHPDIGSIALVPAAATLRKEKVAMKNSRYSPWVLAVFLVSAAIPVLGADKKNSVDEIGNRRVAHRSIISEEKEVAIGREYASVVERSAKMVKDPLVTEYVNRVAQNVARNSDLKVPLTVKLIDSPVINAFALPGGFLYVNSGLLLAADEEDQVAGVMAHEIAHVAARHWASQITKATLLQYGMIPLIVTPMSYPVYEGASQALNLGVPLTFLKFSRSAEAEADYLGLQYMSKAGYDPNSYTAFFGKILQEERRAPGSVPTLFLDHPPTAERIMKSEEEIKEILPKREQYLVSTSEFDDVKERLRAVISKRFERGGPTLERLEDTADPATQTQAGSQRKEQGDGTDDKPPVLQRRQ